jgi:hypothetical protein
MISKDIMTFGCSDRSVTPRRREVMGPLNLVNIKSHLSHLSLEPKILSRESLEKLNCDQQIWQTM